MMAGEFPFELNKIYVGDCMELVKNLPCDSIDLVVTSPPYADVKAYGKTVSVYEPDEYIEWILPLFKEAARFLKPTGSFVLNINDKIQSGARSTYVFELVTRIVKETKLKLYDRYVWVKLQTLPVVGERRLNDRIEYIFHFVRDVRNFKCYTDRLRVPYAESSLKRFKRKMYGTSIVDEHGRRVLTDRGAVKPHPLGRKPTTVFRFDTCSALRGLAHAAPFHYQLPGWFILWLTDEGDVVLDPFMGSGTVGVASVMLNRKFIGFEINPEYVRMATERIDNVKREMASRNCVVDETFVNKLREITARS